MGLQNHAAHAHSLSLRQPLKLRLPFSFFGGEFEVDVTMDVNSAFHHLVIDRHKVGSFFHSSMGRAVTSDKHPDMA
jgi:hypothetical protein